MAHANLIDSILNEPRQGSKVASAEFSDDMLDPTPGPARYHTASSSRATAAAVGEDSLAEAAMQQTIRVSSKSASARPTIEVALKFARTHGSAVRNLSVETKRKLATVSKQLNDAVARLERLSNKSAAQMQQDGATKLADYLNPALVPMWAKQANDDLNLIVRVHALVYPKINKKASTEKFLAERSMTDAEVTGYIHKLLNDGVTPKDVEAKLNKLAELQLFNRQFATDKLRADAGVVGYAFMEPNAYMDSCPSTYQRMETKLGGIRAKSVRQITACTGCQHFKSASGSKRCNLYRLPIIASQKDLLPIINNLTAGAINKKAALVAQANRESERPSTAIKQASEVGNASFKRTEQQVSIRSGKDRVAKKAAKTFTPADALTLHLAGNSIETIYDKAVAKVGSLEANSAVRRFVANLKGSKTKVALTQIDCTMLKGKLATSNGIIGESKCASCTYRKGMHCGMTGGTLLTFPGMDRVKPNHRIASGAPKDGLGMLKEFEMVDSITPGDIEMSKPDFVDIELTGFSKVEL